MRKLICTAIAFFAIFPTASMADEAGYKKAMSDFYHYMTKKSISLDEVRVGKLSRDGIAVYADNGDVTRVYTVMVADSGDILLKIQDDVCIDSSELHEEVVTINSQRVNFLRKCHLQKMTVSERRSLGRQMYSSSYIARSKNGKDFVKKEFSTNKHVVIEFSSEDKALFFTDGFAERIQRNSEPAL